MLSTGQIQDTYKSTLNRAPTPQELSTYSGRSDLEGSPGQTALASELKGGSMTAPTSADGVGGFLKTYQDAISNAQATLNAPKQSSQEMVQSIKDQILPNSPLPTAPNLTQEYQTLITSQGVQDLEKSLGNLKDQENTINTQVETQHAAEEGKPVAMNVIAGRQSEEQRQAQVQLDSIARQKQAVTEELSMRYNTIDTIMKFTQQDYDNALKSYDTQYQQNVTVYNAFNQQVQFDAQQRNEAAKTILDATSAAADLSMKIANEQKQSATANLQIYANMITNGNTTYANMTPDQKLSIQKLEVQSGLGVGFLETLTNGNPKGKVIYAGANGAVMQLPDGSLKTVNYNVSGNGTGTGVSANQARGELQDATAEMTQKLSSVANSYGDISPAQWKQALSKWTGAGFKAQDFINNFKQYADVNRTDFVSAYGFANPQKPTTNKNAPLTFSNK